MSKSPITCHVLDTSLGRPASGINVMLEKTVTYNDDSRLVFEAEGTTDSDGRCTQLWPEAADLETRERLAKLSSGTSYKMTFQTGGYFEDTGRKCFYPFVEITFEVVNPNEHYHIPLLISPYSYTTYRGS